MAEKATASSRSLYSAPKFDQFYKQLKATCKKSDGGRILSKLAVDPITQFLEKQIAKFPKDGDDESKTTSSSESTGEDGDDDSTDSSEEKEEPLKSSNGKSFKNIIKKIKLPNDADRKTKRLLKRIKALKIPSQADFKANPEDTAFAFCT